MFPTLATQNALNRALANAELFGNGHLTHFLFSNKFSNFIDALNRKFSCLPSLNGSISDVFFVVSEKKMSRITAKSVVAFMKNKKRKWVDSRINKPSYSAGNILMLHNRNHSISRVEEAACPLQATIIQWLQFGRKSIYCIHGEFCEIKWFSVHWRIVSTQVI